MAEVAIAGRGAETEGGGRVEEEVMLCKPRTQVGEEIGAE